MKVEQPDLYVFQMAGWDITTVPMDAKEMGLAPNINLPKEPETIAIDQGYLTISNLTSDVLAQVQQTLLAFYKEKRKMPDLETARQMLQEAMKKVYGAGN